MAPGGPAKQPVPPWFWMMDFIDKGFTERQIFEEFSWETIRRYQSYLVAKAKGLEQHREKIEKEHKAKRGGSVARRMPDGRVVAPAKNVWD